MFIDFENCNVGVSVYQELALTPYLFSVIIYEVTKEKQGEVPC